MKENENLDVNNTPAPAEKTNDGLDYSFDFANQVAEDEAKTESLLEASEAPVETLATPEVTPAPVMPEVTTEPVVPEATQAPEPTTVDVSVPIIDENVANETPNAEQKTEETTEETTDGKSTTRFIIILVIIIIAFILGLPFIMKFLG